MAKYSSFAVFSAVISPAVAFIKSAAMGVAMATNCFERITRTSTPEVKTPPPVQREPAPEKLNAELLLEIDRVIDKMDGME